MRLDGLSYVYITLSGKTESPTRKHWSDLMAVTFPWRYSSSLSVRPTIRRGSIVNETNLSLMRDIHRRLSTIRLGGYHDVHDDIIPVWAKIDYLIFLSTRLTVLFGTGAFPFFRPETDNSAETQGKEAVRAGVIVARVVFAGLYRPSHPMYPGASRKHLRQSTCG